MQFYFAAPEWNKKLCPSTTTLACPCEPRAVHSARVIHTKDATYRGSFFSGTFLLGNSVKLPLGNTGKVKIEIYCKWYGHRLKTRGPNILVDLSKTHVEENYHGNIFSNLSKK